MTSESAAVPFHVYTASEPTLLDDLLEASHRIFHQRCAVIQRVFHEKWLATIAEDVGKEQIEHPDDKPALVEERVRWRLRACRVALREKKRELIDEEVRQRDARDQAIRAYVAARADTRQAATAA
jgi:hypothetical protein